MGGKIHDWMYAAVVLGLLQIGELMYNRFGLKLAGEIFAISGMTVAVVWLGTVGVRLIRNVKPNR
ncbi:hypothetical protein [Effusibacillus consociatus]|uniref:Uncharacterized protein n=1 Tax=Effusibacillus consociatus TaxID=1117041 RepID=A0ABV9Q443_9BACL